MDVKKYYVYITAAVIEFYGMFVHADGDYEDRDICEYHGTNGYTYCSKGYRCCQDGTKCCVDDGFPGAAVAGIALSALFFIGVCMGCSVVLAKKKKFRPGQLVSPVSNPRSSSNQQQNYMDYNVTRNYNVSTIAPSYVPPGYPTGPQPPPYDQISSSREPHVSYSHPYSTPIGLPEPPPYCPRDQSAPPAYKPEP